MGTYSYVAVSTAIIRQKHTHKHKKIICFSVCNAVKNEALILIVYSFNT
jgi:hypothetical protein